MKSKIYDVTIIGGGASGLFCAAMIKSKAPEISVAILEKQNTVGKKLLATGNGRCNLTNIYACKDKYHGSFKKYSGYLMDTCSPSVVMGLFEDMGLLTITDNEGRVYPLSKSSASVLDVLTLYCKNNKVDVYTDFFVSDIQKEKNKYKITNKEIELFSDKLVIASGSKATPDTGADDSLLAILSKTFKHTVTKLTPALCPVNVKSKTLNILKGVRASGKVTLKKINDELKTEYGEIQFTDKTLSGICVFNLSRLANTIDNTSIQVSLLPDCSSYEITERLKSRKNKLDGKLTADNLLCGMFNRKIIYALLKDAGIAKEETIENLTENDLKTIVRLINDWQFPVIKSADFKRAQVVHGGISGEEINYKTMESKINKNIYIIGEAVDCDGDCGGFNLQFAFSSAYCAALDITK